MQARNTVLLRVTYPSSCGSPDKWRNVEYIAGHTKSHVERKLDVALKDFR